MLSKEDILSKIKNYFFDDDQVIAVYIFGSFIKGTFNKNSDIDLGLMLRDNIKKVSAFNLKLKIMGELEDLLGCEVDIVIFSQANLRLQHQISKGKLLKGIDNKQRIRREQKLFDQYVDIIYFYKKYEEKLGKGL
jgi:hypothetical protein